MAEPRAVDADLLRGWPLPDPGEDKHARGTVLAVGGSATVPGALLLAGEASLRAGAGKLQLATAASNATALSVAVPEALVQGLPETGGGELDPSAFDTLTELAGSATATLLGPGLTDPAGASALLEAVLPGLECGVVVDALGSAFVTDHPDGLHHLGGRAVLTVNPGELARTLGVDDEEVADDLGGAAATLAERARAVVLCGATSKHVASPDGRRWVADVGGPGLGVSGSGDVQAGIVAGLLARGAEPEQAAVWGGWLHGTAGEALAERYGVVGYLARELPPVVPGLLRDLT